MSELLGVMEQELRNWRWSTRGYAVFYVATRLSMIILSATVAAQNNLKTTAVEAIVRWVPILAVAVTILTSIDTWQKPQVKWRGFMKDRDDLQHLIVRMKDGRSEDDKLWQEFADLRSRHRSENVY
jgi:hypothetical protein